MTKWKMLGSVFNIVNFPQNFTTCGFLFSTTITSIYTGFTHISLFSSNWQIYDGASLQILL